MRTNRGITIGVLSGGKMAEEYGHQNEDECTVSCFIPGEQDETFEIFVSNDLAKQDVAISIRIDNTFIGRYFLGLGQNVLPGLYVSDRVTKPFCFRGLNVQDQQTLRDPQYWRWETMGLMEFSVYRCVKKSRERFRSAYITSIPDDASAAGFSRNSSPGTERASSRAGSRQADWSREREESHSVSTGPERSIPPIEGVQGVTLDPPDEPFARLVFRYRPRTALQAQGIIPPRFSVPPAPSRRSSVQPPYAPSHTTRSPSAQPPPTQLAPMRPPSEWAVEEVRRGWAPATAESPQRDTHSRQATPVHPRRYSPYPPPASNPRVPSRAHSLPDHATAPVPALRIADSTMEELASIKSQMVHVYDQMQLAMQQIRRSAETVEESMRQLRFLQRKLEVLEVRQRQAQQPPPPSAPPTAPAQLIKAEPLTPAAAAQRQQAAARSSPQLQWPA